MSDLYKPLYGQYGFIRDEDRLSTLANLGFGDDADAAEAVVDNLALAGTSTTLTDGATVDIDWATSNVFKLTAAGTTTITFSNTTEKTIELALTGGAATVITYPTVSWTRGSAPQNPASTKVQVIRFQKIGTVFYGTVLTDTDTVPVATYDGASAVITDGATPTMNWQLSNVFTWSAAGTSTLSFSNTTEKTVVLVLTGGAASVITYPTISWDRGVAPQNPANTKVQVVRIQKVGAVFYGTVLTDTDTVPVAQESGTSSTVAYAATTNLDWTTSNVFKVAITGNVTFTFSNTTEKVIDLFVAVSGTRTIAFPAALWDGGAEPADPADTKTGWYRFRKVGVVFYAQMISVNIS